MTLARKLDASPGWAVVTRPFPSAELETMAGFLICDGRGRVALCSPSAAQALAADPAEIEGRPLDSLLHDAAPPSLRRVDLAGLSGKIGWHRFNMPRPGGGRVPVVVSVEKLEVDRLGYFLVRLHRLQDA